ncbi:linamarin synthase 1-like [Rhodamnia argentea]|uniref:Glycosyltransferase n=1 Tax=Rhodamnia argentea TaxID=178133 RepID=A0ABM3H5I7_9MYRT|nr:linamarin synthase 1-like [Rhodamnia argentea]
MHFFDLALGRAMAMGSSSQESRKPHALAHAVCVPFPAQGHINPMTQLAQLLHARGVFITFVNTEFNHRRLLRSKGPDSLRNLENFRFETIPDGLPPSDHDATQDPPALCYSTRKNCLGPFKELLARINSDEAVPPVSCVIADGVASFASKAARELGIPEVRFWTASACGFMGYLQYRELANRGIVPFKDEDFLNNGTLDDPVDWIPGMRNIRLRDIPSFIRTTDPNDIMLNYAEEEAQHCLKSSAILFNTFNELEHEVLEKIADMSRRIYCTGPLSFLVQDIPSSSVKSFRSNLWKENYSCLKWLDQREAESVVYVNYGSVTVMTEEHLREFAWGLANSKHPFLWVVRPDVVMGDSTILPQEFLEEVKDRGFLTSWCPQDRVLSHGSIGAFLTHCGWNSTLEGICEGVPLICWPFFAEQQTNCRYACTDWGIGMEANQEVRREEIEALVREVMDGVGGKKLRENAKKWKERAVEAAGRGGSSHNDFNRFIKEVVHLND